MMHWIKYRFRWELKPLLAWSVILGLFSLSFGYIYSQLNEAGIYEALQNLPPFVKAFLGRGGISIATLEGFLTLEYFSWMGLMFAIYAIVSAAGAIAEEIENNTMDPLLAKPFPRASFYWGKITVYVLTSLILVSFNFLALWLGLWLVGEKLPFDVWIDSFLLTASAVLPFLSLSFFFSSVFDHTRQAMVFALGLTVFQYLFNSITTAVRKSSWAKWTVSYHADASRVLAGDPFPWGSLAFILVLAAVVAAAGWVVFERRDI